MILTLILMHSEATDAVRVIVKRNRFAGMPLGCLLSIFGLTLVGLWTWYAISVSEWRFAAIVWIPFISNLIGRLAVRRRPT